MPVSFSTKCMALKIHNVIQSGMVSQDSIPAKVYFLSQQKFT